MQAVDQALFVIEKTHAIGRMQGSILAQCQGWDRVKASRYLTYLARRGWLERVNTKGIPVYVLGRKLLSMIPDIRL